MGGKSRMGCHCNIAMQCIVSGFIYEVLLKVRLVIIILLCQNTTLGHSVSQPSRDLRCAPKELYSGRTYKYSNNQLFKYSGRTYKYENVFPKILVSIYGANGENFLSVSDLCPVNKFCCCFEME